MYAHCTFVVAKMLDFCVNAFVQGSGGRSAARLIVEMGCDDGTKRGIR
jgi:hypothetical protein